MTDPILDELHKTRRQLLADAGGTVEGLAARLQERQRASGRQILHARRAVICKGNEKPTDALMEDQSILPSGE